MGIIVVCFVVATIDLVFRKNLSVVCVLNIPLALAIVSLSASTRSLAKGKVNGFTDLACP